MATRNRGLKQRVVEYMRQNVDRAVTLDELDKELDGHKRGSISSTMSALCRDDNYPAVSMGAGIYKWHSTRPRTEGIARGDLMEVIVVNDGDGRKVLVRDDHDEVWVAKRLNLEDV